MRTLRTGEGVPGVHGSGDCEDDMAAGAHPGGVGALGAAWCGTVVTVRCGQWADSNESRRRGRVATAEAPSGAQLPIGGGPCSLSPLLDHVLD